MLLALAPLASARGLVPDTVPPEAVADLDMQARRCLERGDYAAAAAKWGTAVRMAPTSVDLRNRLGMALTKLKRYAEAEDEFRAAAALAPAEPKTLFNLGLLYLHQGDMARAKDALCRTLRAAPWYPETHYHLGLIAEAAGQTREATDAYIQELNANAGCAKAWLRLRALQRKARAPDRAATAAVGHTGRVLGALGFGIGLACLFLSRHRVGRTAALVAIAVGVCTSAQAEVDYAAYREAVSADALRRTIVRLSSHPSRTLGYEGCARAARYIEDEFRRIGLSNVRTDTFTVPMPLDRGASITVLSTGKRYRIHPFWPNLVRLPILPDGGVTGSLIDAGRGRFPDLDGKDVDRSIALLDMATEDRFVDLRVLGVRAILFPEPDSMTRGQGEFKFLSSPVNIPRFWVPKPAAAELRRLARGGRAQVKVECKMEWRPVEAKNIYGYLKGRKARAEVIRPRTNWHMLVWPILALWAACWAFTRSSEMGARRAAVLPALMAASALLVLLLYGIVALSAQREYRQKKRHEEDLVILEAYYDSVSVVPGLSPGAEQACGVAALMQFAELFHKHRPRRSVLFVATSGHCQALAGISDFMLSHSRSERFRQRVSNPVFRARFKEQIDFNLLIGLDLSSHTRRLGIFHEGHFTTLGQRPVLANRRYFAPYGQRFTRYAKRIEGERVLAKLAQHMKAEGKELTQDIRLAAETVIAEFASFSVRDVPRWSQRSRDELTEEAVQAAVEAMIAVGIMKPAEKYEVNPSRFPVADPTLLFKSKKLGLWARAATALGLQRPVPKDLPRLPAELQSIVTMVAEHKKPFKPDDIIPEEVREFYDSLLQLERDRIGRPKGQGEGIADKDIAIPTKSFRSRTLAGLKIDEELYAKAAPVLDKHGLDVKRRDGISVGEIAALVDPALVSRAIDTLGKHGAVVKKYEYEAENFLENGITPVGGVIWQSFMPGLLALDSEALVKMALPGLSFVSVNDSRRFVDTPMDTPDRMDMDSLAGQVRRLACMLAHALNDERFYPGTKVKLREFAKAMRGRIVEFRIGESLLPDYPVQGALVVLRDPGAQVKGQWEKTFMGVRGTALAMTDQEGYFEHSFVPTTSVSIEAYKVDPCTGEIVYAADRGPEGDGTYPLIVPMDWQLKESQTVVFKCRTLDIFDLYDPRYLRSLDTINVLGPLDFAPLRYGYSELAGRGASLFFEEHERVKVVMGSGVFGIQYLLTNVQPSAAHGFVTLRADRPATKKVRIPKGLRVTGERDRPYHTTEDVYLAKGATMATAPVQAVIPGIAGNVGAKELSEFVTQPPTGIVTVANERAIDNGDDNPTGVGFPANPDSALFRTAHLAAENMFVLNESRIRDLRRYGIRNDRLERLHGQAGVALRLAEQAYRDKRYSDYIKHVRAARGFEAKAYPDVRGTANDTVKGIIFYFALLLPFAFFLERLLFGFADIRKQIGAAAAMFVLVFIVLRFVHPAFQLSTSPYIIFLAFVLLAMAVFVITIVVTKFNEQVAEMRRKAAKVHEADVGRLSASAAAFSLGISNMKKRKLRTALTTVTLILLTFTVLSFTSVNTYTRFYRIPIHPKPEWYGLTPKCLERLAAERLPADVVQRLTALKGQRFATDDELRDAVQGRLGSDEFDAHWPRIRDRAKKPHYRGMLVRDRNWNFMEDIAYEYVFSGFTNEPEAVTFAPRAWYMSTTREGELHIRVEGPGGESSHAVAVIGMTPEERHTTGIDRDEYMLAGRWLDKGDRRVCILPSNMAERVGIAPEDVGKKDVTLFGEPFRVQGILRTEALAKLVDLDNEQLSPVDMSAEDPQFDPSESVATLRSNAADIRTFTHLDPNGCVYVPYDVVVEHGGTLRSIAVRLADSVEFEAFLTLVKKFMSRVGMTIWVSDGERVEAYSSMGLSSFSGLGNMLVPICIAGLIVLNTMMGAVYERFREIGIYSSVGLAPVHIGALFLAESCVYAVVGAIAGYLVGQVVGTAVARLGLLPGITLNYSSMSAVASTFIVMAVVILSTLYPAKVASSMAVPDVTRKWKFPDADGDDWTFDFPFTVASSHVLGLYVFLNNYFDGYKEESVGSFYTNEVEFLTLESEHGQGYLIRMNVWLAPFDMGISQNVELRALPTEDAGIARIQVFIHRMSGEVSSWQRLNKGFLTEIRKQFLIWRTVPEGVKLEYAEQGKRLLVEAEAAV